MAQLVVHRLSGGSRLVIDDPTALAAVYFGPGVVGSRFAPYDEAAAADTHCDQITDDDISVINRTFGARSPHKEWIRFTNDPKPLEALEAIGHDWSLLEMSQADWVGHHVADRIADVLDVLRGPHRNAAVLSKVLHLKRPALIPVLDSLIGQQVGWTLGVPPIALIEHLRREGVANLEVLRAAQSHLRTLGVERTLVRIFDALLWISHPAASLASRLDGWDRRFGPTPA